jgi:predicted MFS family arabinose efflux permease
MRSPLAGLHYGWIILLLSVLVVMGSLGFARFGYTMVLPSMKEGLQISDIQAGDLATGNMIGYLLLSVVGGVLASRFGPKRIILASMVLVSLAMVLTGFASSFSMALAGRILAGVGSGGANVPVMGLVASWFAAKKRGLATGIAVSGSSFGLLITGSLVPVVLRVFAPQGWRIAWYAMAVINTGFIILCWAFLRNAPPDAGTAPSGSPEAGAEQRDARASSWQWSRVYRSPRVWQLGAIYSMFGFSYIIYATFFARYLIGKAGFTTESAGALWSAIGALSIVSGFIWGSVSDVFGRKYALALVYLLQAFSFGLFGLWKSPAGFYFSALLFALTAWSIPAIMAALTGDLLGGRLAPAALGFVTVFFGSGQALGPLVGGRIAHVLSSFGPAFVVAGIAALAGGAASLLIRPAGRRRR